VKGKNCPKVCLAGLKKPESTSLKQQEEQLQYLAHKASFAKNFFVYGKISEGNPASS
jgi:hypothetical protein